MNQIPLILRPLFYVWKFLDMFGIYFETLRIIVLVAERPSVPSPAEFLKSGP